MTTQQRRDAGTAMRRRVLGDRHVDRAIARTTPLSADFQDFITRYAWGEIWTRPHFDIRTRRLLVIGSMIALGRWDELRLHVRAALDQHELSEDDLVEIVLQQAIYCGVPAANNALEVIREIREAPASDVPPSGR
jgi:4-carboxymuconolactone decarboxylase